MSRRLDDQVMPITWSTHGIGVQMARQFATEGASVVISGRSVESDRSVETEIAETRGAALYVPADITVPAEVERAVAAGVRQFGRLTSLVNNAVDRQVADMPGIPSDAPVDMDAATRLRLAGAAVPTT